MNLERWQMYAVAAAIFAGITSVLAKLGLAKLGADVGLAVRTLFVCVFVMVNTWVWTGAGKTIAEISTVGWRPLLWLALSALTTTCSWICYYRAMHEGTVSYVALIDKGSILVTLALSVLLLGETFTWRMGVGGGMVLAGLLVLASGK